MKKLILLISMILLISCTNIEKIEKTKYVCSDGKIVFNPTLCEEKKEIIIMEEKETIMGDLKGRCGILNSFGIMTTMTDYQCEKDEDCYSLSCVFGTDEREMKCVK